MNNEHHRVIHKLSTVLGKQKHAKQKARTSRRLSSNPSPQIFFRCPSIASETKIGLLGHDKGSVACSS